MKNAIIFLFLIFIFANCEKIFHPEEISIGKIQTFNELVHATNGVYAKLAQAYNTMFFNLAGTKGDDLNNMPPNYFGYYGYYGFEDCWKEDLYERNTSVVWYQLYSVIASANSVLNQYNLTSSLDKLTYEILGELYFIKAYCYFRLTRTYGEIPFIDDTDISYSTPKSSFAEIYGNIENNLKLAILHLPGNNLVARIPYETPHKGSAKALLAEVYLSWAGYPVRDNSKYVLASQIAEEVIDSSDYFTLGLLNDFSYLWCSDYYGNKESLFTLYYSNPKYSTQTKEFNNSYMGFVVSDYRYGTDFMLYRQSSFISISYNCVEVSFYNKYPPGYRKDITFYSRIFIPDGLNDLDTGYIHLEKVNICNRIGYRKFYYEPSEVPAIQYFEGYNAIYYMGMPKIYLFRYAHTLLTYAEASARSGQLDEKAYECVNMIRRRANNTDIYSPSVYDLQPGLSPEVFADSVVWERAWELAGEPEGRWFDLVRLEMVEDLPNLRHPQEGGPPETFDKSAYFFPIPQGDVDLNPNLGR